MMTASNGSASNTAVVAALSHQAQYCGPYKIEKTLGKGQTGIQRIPVRYYETQSKISIGYTAQHEFLSLNKVNE
ncbi:unnamed protein product [Thelazia callipaeda]|uniref:Protein kinase domain-containing protein n=1 Tax=Thelazia callipaeda TaxID=103827 RepID=A0A0N5CZ50_THECL|nr:unnamed protein product [Thelazia callipaeda]